MARPKGDKVGMAITVWMDEKDVARIDRFAESLGLSRSRMTSNLAKAGLEDAEVMDAFGLFSLVRRIEAGLSKLSPERAESLPPAGKRA
jgi:hypothetical protein